PHGRLLLRPARRPARPVGARQGLGGRRRRRPARGRRRDELLHQRGRRRRRGRPAPGRRWRIGIRHPGDLGHVAAVLAVEDLAVATSGEYERGAHILDPHTGRPPAGLLSVTIVGPDLATADAYATAACSARPASPATASEPSPGLSGSSREAFSRLAHGVPTMRTCQPPSPLPSAATAGPSPARSPPSPPPACSPPAARRAPRRPPRPATPPRRLRALLRPGSKACRPASGRPSPAPPPTRPRRPPSPS